jgi:hypothetical protein
MLNFRSRFCSRCSLTIFKFDSMSASWLQAWRKAARAAAADNCKEETCYRLLDNEVDDKENVAFWQRSPFPTRQYMRGQKRTTLATKLLWSVVILSLCFNIVLPVVLVRPRSDLQLALRWGSFSRGFRTEWCKSHHSQPAFTSFEE